MKAGCPKSHNRDAVVVAHIRQIEREHDHNYGVQKVYEELNDKGINIGRSKVQRIMHVHHMESPNQKQIQAANPITIPAEGIVPWVAFRRCYEIRRNLPFNLSA